MGSRSSRSRTCNGCGCWRGCSAHWGCRAGRGRELCHHRLRPARATSGAAGAAVRTGTRGTQGQSVPTVRHVQRQPGHGPAVTAFCLLLGLCGTARAPSPGDQAFLQYAVYALPTLLSIEPGEVFVGTLKGPSQGHCELGAVEGIGAWWLFYLDGHTGTFRCVASGRRSPVLIVDEALSDGVYGEFRCLEPDPAGWQSEGGGEYSTPLLPVPCDQPFPGPQLPFVLPSGP